MGTLTKKLHILKTGGTEETCNIYTTPEEVGGSPYLALEVDGTKGYVKLGSTTDANATHLRVEKNGTTYAAWKEAEATVPTGSLHSNATLDTFTVPQGIKVLKLVMDGYGDIAQYVGVTPGKTYSSISGYETLYGQGDLWEVWVLRGSGSTWFYETNGQGDDVMAEGMMGFTIYWSPEINKMNPTHTDY